MLTHFDQLKYGTHADIEVLVDRDTREIWVAQATIMRMLGFDGADGVSKKIASKGFKAYAGAGLACAKTVKAKDITGRPNTVKAIPFDTFLKFVFWQSKQDNPAADALLLAGFADSFSSLILEQCGVKVTTGERQKVVSHYLSSYHDLFDWIRDEHLQVYGRKPESDYYADVNRTFNQILFGCNHFKCDRLTNAGNRALWKLESTQRWIKEEKIDKGWGQQIQDPAERVIAALESML